jgi:hypothetical protein
MAYPINHISLDPYRDDRGGMHDGAQLSDSEFISLSQCLGRRLHPGELIGNSGCPRLELSQSLRRKKGRDRKVDYQA